uniref:Uncharacterized protein n=1 Tax=Micrurus spixii TaxID=129469 RepID=A0A2D4LV98_9SAUR
MMGNLGEFQPGWRILGVEVHTSSRFGTLPSGKHWPRTSQNICKCSSSSFTMDVVAFSFLIFSIFQDYIKNTLRHPSRLSNQGQSTGRSVLMIEKIAIVASHKGVPIIFCEWARKKWRQINWTGDISQNRQTFLCYL